MPSARHHGLLIGIYVAVALITVSLPAIAAGGTAGATASSVVKTAPATRTLLRLLDESKIPYAKVADGATAKISIDDGKGGVRAVAMWEKGLGPSPENRLICLSIEVFKLPKGTLSSKFISRVADLNENMLVGRLSRTTASLVYYSSFWLRTADSQTLMTELQVAAQAREQAEQELQPLLK